MIASESLPAQFNVASWFVDRNVAEGRGAAPALQYEGRTLTYAQVQELVNRTGNALLEIGVEPENRVFMLCLDEPTSGLGADGTARLAELVQELRRVLTIVIIEHDMAFLFRLADRISVIHWGQVIAEGTPDALRADPWIARSGLGAAV